MLREAKVQGQKMKEEAARLEEEKKKEELRKKLEVSPTKGGKKGKGGQGGQSPGKKSRNVDFRVNKPIVKKKDADEEFLEARAKKKNDFLIKYMKDLVKNCNYINQIIRSDLEYIRYC